jgi:hypothetical protein
VKIPGAEDAVVAETKVRDYLLSTDIESEVPRRGSSPSLDSSSGIGSLSKANLVGSPPTTRSSGPRQDLDRSHGDLGAVVKVHGGEQSRLNSSQHPGEHKHF